MQESTSIVWLRHDFRLADNPAVAAGSQSQNCYLVYIHEDHESLGAASRWWLHRSLQALDEKIKRRQGALIIRQGVAKEVLPELATQLNATHVFWNRRYQKSEIDRDSEVKELLRNQGLQVKSFASRYLMEPWELKNQAGQPYKVFTPFSKAFLNFEISRPSFPEIKKLSAPPTSVSNLAVDELHLMPSLQWYHSFEKHWHPGEAGARQMLERFKGHVKDYAKHRDFPALVGTSRLSAHLHFGEIAPQRVWYELSRLEEKRIDSFPYLRQLIWREFANYCLFHFPQLPHESLRTEFKRFPWSKKTSMLKAWQKGLTGFPIIDAGMRELWATGWMHNRVRMIVGSFLVKNLRIHWLEGERWFWDTLVDADLANNSMGWQWVAGTGIDAAPYFRIFNPTLQSEKFDPQGTYIRQWVPEIARLPDKWLHKPEMAPQKVLQELGLTLGKDYPKPIVDFKISRQEALAGYQALK